jgi:outer membrane lipoprotein-sorting protein
MYTTILPKKSQKMRSLRVVLMAASMLSVFSLRAQTADEIVNKHIEALGGKDKLAGIKTVYTEYDLDVMGQQVAGATWLVNGKAYKNEVSFGGQKIVQCFTDQGGWGINPMMGQTGAEALPEDQVKAGKAQLDAGGPLFNYATKGNTVELVGKEAVGATAQAFKLKLKTRDSVESFFWIDPATYYIIKSTVKTNAQGNEIETTISFSNYKKTDYGFVMPTTTEISMSQGLVLNINSKKTEINKEIDMKMFEMPK